jgi:hypothetical protein
MFKDYIGKDNNSPPKSKELRSYLSLAVAAGIPCQHCLRGLPKILLAKFSLNGPFIAIKEPLYSKFC